MSLDLSRMNDAIYIHRWKPEIRTYMPVFYIDTSGRTSVAVPRRWQSEN